MNSRLFISTFFLIFLAELGDKTQLSVVGRAADPAAKWTVFAAGSLALIVSTFVAVQFGSLLTRLVDPRFIKLGAGVLFLVIGGLMLAEGVRPAEAVAAEPARATGVLGRFVLSQAAAFERAAFADYQRLAEKAASPALRKLLEELAAEEEAHAARVSGLHEDHAESELPAEAVAGLPAEAELTHNVSSDDAPLIEHAVEHELATVSFYRQLAHVTPIPGLRHAFATLAEAEERHAARLRALATAQPPTSSFG